MAKNTFAAVLTIKRTLKYPFVTLSYVIESILKKEANYNLVKTQWMYQMGQDIQEWTK